jgi:hypothetical protein
MWQQLPPHGRTEGGGVASPDRASRLSFSFRLFRICAYPPGAPELTTGRPVTGVPNWFRQRLCEEHFCISQEFVYFYYRKARNFDMEAQRENNLNWALQFLNHGAPIAYSFLPVSPLPPLRQNLFDALSVRYERTPQPNVWFISILGRFWIPPAGFSLVAGLSIFYFSGRRIYSGFLFSRGGFFGFFRSGFHATFKFSEHFQM